MTTSTAPLSLAAPAPIDREEITPPDTSHMHDLCERWGIWCRNRRLFGPPPLGAGTLGKLQRRSRRYREPDAACSAELSALNLAITAQPNDTMRAVFEAYYLHGASNIKVHAEQIGISRATWYRYLAEFRARVYAAHHRILAANLAAAASLPHYQAHQ